MNPQLLPAQLRDDAPVWTQTVVAFLAEKERRASERFLDPFVRGEALDLEIYGGPGLPHPGTRR